MLCSPGCYQFPILLTIPTNIKTSFSHRKQQLFIA
jgi:hypothetical protein